MRIFYWTLETDERFEDRLVKRPDFRFHVDPDACVLIENINDTRNLSTFNDHITMPFLARQITKYHATWRKKKSFLLLILLIGCHGNNMRKLESGDFILGFLTFG